MFINKNKPFSNAKISSNYNDNINNAFKLINLAKKANSEALKLKKG